MDRDAWASLGLFVGIPLAVLFLFGTACAPAHAWSGRDYPPGTLPHGGPGWNDGWQPQYRGGFQQGHQSHGSTMRPFDSNLYDAPSGCAWAWSDRLGGWTRVC